MRKSIPGFYFDEEKNRYFRIQPNQSTTSSIAQHSVDGVKQLQQSSKKRRLEEVNASRRRNQNIVRCRQLQHPGFGGSLSTILRPLNPSQSLEIRSNIVISALRPTKEPIKPITSASFSRIHHDPHSNELFAFQTRFPDAGTDTEPISTIHTHQRLAPSSRFTSHGTPLQGTLCQGNPISLDICRVSDDLRVLIAICGKSYGGTIYLRQMPEAHNPEGLSSYSGVEVQFLLGGVTPWSSSVSRDSPQFVVASSGGLYLTFAAEDSWTLKQLRRGQQQQPRRDREREEFLNVDWQGRNVVSAGDRSGRVVFVDTRAQDRVTRLKLRSAVTGIRKVNEHQLVARSFDEMNMYDLRYAKRPHGKNSATKPWLSFPQYQSALRPTGNFDYDETLGLIATGTDTPNHLALYSTRSGKLAPTKLNTHSHSHSPEAALNDIKFATSPTEPPSLLLARDNTVEEWAYS